jgi:hypothetical protein
MANSTSTKASNTTNKETTTNKSSSSEEKQPNSDYTSPRSMLEPSIKEVSGEFECIDRGKARGVYRRRQGAVHRTAKQSKLFSNGIFDSGI